MIADDRTDDAFPSRRSPNGWLVQLSLLLALVVSAINVGDRLPRIHDGAPASVGAVELSAIIGSRQSVAIVKLERSSVQDKAPRLLDGASPSRPTVIARTAVPFVWHRASARGLGVGAWHQAYRARPPPSGFSLSDLFS